MTAKRHHYVPRFLLQRFSPEPEAKNPKIHKLDLDTGRTTVSSVLNEAVISHFNRIENVPGMTASTVEDTLAMVEGASIPIINGLTAGIHPSPEERLTLGLFIYLQHQRTPLGREWATFLLEQAGKLEAISRLTDSKHLADFFASQGEPKTAEEITTFQNETIRQLQDGELIVSKGPDGEVLGGFLGADLIGPKIAYEMTWTGLRTPKGAEFIISDHPVAICDPRAPLGAPVMWQSSHTVEVTIPLSSNFCLLLTAGPPAYVDRECEPKSVTDVNLRTYAWGHWAIYGTSQHVLQCVRSQAKRKSMKVKHYEPRAPGMTIFERFEGALEPFNAITDRAPARGLRRRKRYS